MSISAVEGQAARHVPIDFYAQSLRPPLWVICYAGSIFAAGVAGSATDTIAGANIEHVFLGCALGLAVMFLVFDGNFRRIGGLDRVSKYLALFGLAIFLGFLSSIHPGPKIVGADTLIYWCGLVISIGVAALACLCGYTSWVLVAIALAGLPLIASVLEPFAPFLSRLIPTQRLHPSPQGRIAGLFLNPNTMGFSLYCSLAGCLCLYHRLRGGWVRWGCLFLSLLYMGAILLTVSRGSILIMLLTMAVFLYSVWRRASCARAVVLIMLAVVGGALYRTSLNVDWQRLSFARISDRSTYESDSFRVHALRSVASDAGKLFFLGEGSGQFAERSHIYLKGFSSPYIGIYDKSPHNQVLAIWVEWGLLAVILMYSAHAWVIVRGFRIGHWCFDDVEFMLAVAYMSILLSLQMHGINSPASCALLGLYLGHVFRHDPRMTRQSLSVS